MTDWPADNVTRWPVKRLTPYARNARTHSKEQVAQIAASIQEFGFTNPILVDEDGTIIAGHGRVLAAQKLGLAELPVMVATGWSEAQRRAYVLADNKLALNAGWDTDMLRVELTDLRGMGFDLGLAGFTEDEFAVLSASATDGLTDPDDVPVMPVDPVTVLGDVWLLGRHRLVCGDSTTVESVDAALAGVKPHLMVTDPPYGVQYDAGWRTRVGASGAGAATGKVLNDDRADWSEVWALFPGQVAYVWHAGTQAELVQASLKRAGFAIRAQIVWVKTRPVFSRGDYHHQHEPAFYAAKDGEDDSWQFVSEHEVAEYAVAKGKVGKWSGSRKQSTVWFIEHVKSETGHSTQKPVEAMKRPIENNSKPGDAVYEPFSGSGTTIIAAAITGRYCCAIELSPAYVDVAVKRWQAFVGQDATLQGDGRTFNEISGERLKAVG
jgi:DNA modification methylase